MADTDRIEVRVLAGRDFPEKSGGTCNPCVKVSFGSQTAFTKTLSRTRSPKWLSGPPMIFTSVASSGEQHLVATLVHKNISSGVFEEVGVISINAASAMQSPSVALDDWFPLSASTGGGGTIGDLRVRVTYFLKDAFWEEETSAAATGQQAAAVLPERRPPNCLKIEVGQARHLRPVDSTGACNAYVSVSCAGEKATTAVVKGPDPRFEQSFSIPVVSGTSMVDVKVKHKGRIGRSLVGVARIPMVDILGSGESGKSRCLPLLSSQNQFEAGGDGRGEIDVAFSWVYDEKYQGLAGAASNSFSKLVKSLKESGTNNNSSLAAIAESSNTQGEPLEDDQESDCLPLSLREQQQLDNLRAERLLQAREQLDRYEAHTSSLKQGDLAVLVHVIEAQDLKAEGGGGVSNPFVKVSCMGQRQKTRVRKGTNTCVFNEKLFFNFKDVNPSKVREADVVLSVESRNRLSTPCIGKFSLNLLTVYGQKDHEYYDQWVALSDPTDKKDVGVMGYLKLSVSVLGPGDAHKAHDPEKEYLEAKAAESLLGSTTTDGSGGGGGGSNTEKLVLTPATIRQELQFLVVSVFEAQGLPMMDRHSHGGLGGKGIDAFVQCEFAGNPALRTKVVHARGKEDLSVEFNEQLWLPVYSPTMSSSVALSLWDRDLFTANKCVAHTYFDFKTLPKLPQPKTNNGLVGLTSLLSANKFDGPPPMWVNLYGAAADLRGSKAGKVENTFPDNASTFRGRLLVSLHVYTHPNSRELDQIHKKALPDIPAALYPKIMPYTFRVSLLLGSELPMFYSLLSGTTASAQLRVVVEFGPQRFVFSAAPVVRGRAMWVEIKEQRGIELPARVDLLPDVGIYLCRGSEKSFATLSYARIPAAKFLAESFKGNPFWQKLHPDASRQALKAGLKETQYPGALLLRVGLGIDADGREHKWSDDKKNAVTDTQPYKIRVHVYQGRNLPSGDPNGLLDPYVKVWFCGNKQKTAIKHDTTSPLYYETLEFDEVLPTDLRFAPEVVLQVWDSDAPPPLGHNSQVGLARFDLTNAKVTSAAMQGSGPKPPIWVNVDDGHGKPTGGALLVSVHVVKKRSLAEKIEPACSIEPAMRQAYLEITALGVRNMRRFQRSHVQEPFVQFDLPGPTSSNEGGGSTTFTTTPSKTPRGRDANFLKQTVLPVRIAENPAFAPQLGIRVFDRRFGGLDTPLVGAASIPLHSFLPWNRDVYHSPQSQLFDPLAMAELEYADLLEGEEEGAFVNDNHTTETARDAPPVNGNAAAAGSSFLRAPSDDEADESSEEALDAGVGAFRDADAVGPLPPDNAGEEEIDALLRVDEEEEEERPWRWWPWSRKEQPEDNALVGSEELDPQKLGIAFPTSWAETKFMEGRTWWLDQQSSSSSSSGSSSESKELESYLETMPFEHYPLLRGIYNSNPSKSTVRVVGTFKGLIRITEDDPRRSPLIDMKTLERVEKFKVRVYVLRGRNLQPVGGGLSDPYLRLKLGGETVVNDKSSMQVSTTDPSFYQMYELETAIPGLTTLEIEVRDFQKNALLTHELVGSTSIDLEDRWFHAQWQALGRPGAPGYLEHPATEGGGQHHQHQPRALLKPLESRRLLLPGTSVAQGQLEMWVEIVPSDKARLSPPTVLQKPPTKKFELRIVCWKAEGVPKKCGKDLFATFKMRLPSGNVKKSTDTHLACKDGNPSWNYRVVIPIELPMKDPLQARLTVQLWDFDLASSNDIVAERQIDLYQWLLMAYHSDKEVLPFKIMKKAKEDQERAALEGSTGLEDEERADRINLMGQPSYATMLPGGESLDFDLEAGGGNGELNPLLQQQGKNTPEVEGGTEDEDDEPNDDVEMAKDAWHSLLSMAGLGPIAEDAMWLNMAHYSQKKKKLRQRGRMALSVSIVPQDECEAKPAGQGRREPNANPYLPPPVGRLSFFVSPCKIILAFCPTGLLCCLTTFVVLTLVLLLVFYLGNYYVIFETWKND